MIVAKSPISTYKNMYGYFIDPIHFTHERLQNIVEVSNANILTSFVAAVGVWSIVSLVI